MASKPDPSSPDELARGITEILEAIDEAAAALCASDQGVVFLEDDEDPSAIAAAIVEAERVRGCALTVLWGLDRSWLAWHWPAEGAPALIGFILADELGAPSS